MQVELAQLRYRLPRLRGRGIELSQQAGGIGTRRPGRDPARGRPAAHPATHEQARRRARAPRQDPGHPAQGPPPPELPRISLVGYTNAGKSTLLNRLTNADALVEDRCSRRSIPRPVACTSRAARLRCSATRSGSCAACRTSWSRPSGRRSRRSPRSTCSSTSSTPAPRRRAADRGRRRRAARDRRRPPTRAARREQDRPRRSGTTSTTCSRTPDRSRSRRRPARASRSSTRCSAIGCARSTRSSSSRPVRTGRRLAALHREGDVLVEVHGDAGDRARARIPESACQPLSRVRGAERRRRRHAPDRRRARVACDSWPSPGSSRRRTRTTASMRCPPRRQRARRHRRLLGRHADRSDSRCRGGARRRRGCRHRIPRHVGAGSIPREAAAAWIAAASTSRCRPTPSSRASAPKSSSASLPHARAARPRTRHRAVSRPSRTRRTRWAPAGRLRARAGALDERLASRSRPALGEADAERALVIWVNEPGNPTGSSPTPPLPRGRLGSGAAIVVARVTSATSSSRPSPRRSC